jgi:hypothetical protein
VSIHVPGNTTNVKIKTKARAIKNGHATLKLLYIMIKKAFKGETTTLLSERFVFVT